MAGNHVLLETIALTQSATSVTFDNLPTSGYTDLKIVASARTTRTSNSQDWIKISFNGLTTNLSMRALYGDGSSTGSYSDTSIYSATTSDAATANTFGNTEFYIPNYRSSNFKSVSADGVSENNATLVTDTLNAGLWSSTAAITSITLTPYTGPNFVANSTFSLYGVAAFGTTPTVAPKATGGNIVANDGTYWYHAFTSSGNFVPQTELTADAIIIGAGGGGGSDVGGAGAGRVYNLTALSMASATNYVCTIGAGGVPVPSANAGLKGTDSSLIGGLLSYTSLGGGGGNGRQYATAALNDGWNGGGGGYDASRGPTAGNGGFAGGATVNPGSNPTYSGGGGGAAEAGNTDGTGQGGDGTSTYATWLTATNCGVSNGSTLLVAGGGGGGMYGSSSSNALGGDGGGGFGGDNDQGGANGVANTGSGGGGAGSSQVGGTGGSGLIIIRYPMTS